MSYVGLTKGMEKVLVTLEEIKASDGSSSHNLEPVVGNPSIKPLVASTVQQAFNPNAPVLIKDLNAKEELHNGPFIGP